LKQIQQTHDSIIMALKKLQFSRSAKLRKSSKHIVDSSWSKSSQSVRSFVNKLSLSNIRSSLNGAMTTCPLPITIQCGLSSDVSRYVALAAGSYCDVESVLLRDFSEVRRPGAVRSTQVGFMSPYYTSAKAGNTEEYRNPTYEQVMSGTSGHVMVVLVELADPVADFEDLIRFFFQIHDPTTKYRQGPHRGFHFASWIFCGDQEQYNVAKRVRSEVQELLDQGSFRNIYSSRSVTTNMSIMNEFIPGPEEHQQYLIKNTDELCCRSNRVRFESWPSLGPDDASSMGFASDSIGSDDNEERMETAVQSSAHFRKKESLVHTMLRISMCDGDRDQEEESSLM
jgi:methionine-S-sulfoxide reductase